MQKEMKDACCCMDYETTDSSEDEEEDAFVADDEGYDTGCLDS